ncbi:MAG TPA: DUF1890 family protein [Methanocorpusculum sp.]|nr:DUF1890 family protein [Methanocorpusculum sp.]
MGEVLILIGCPQIPVQSSLVLYIADFLQDAGHRPIVAANPSAKQLIKTSDPKSHYVSVYKDVDKTIGELADGTIKYPLIISLIHNDAGLTYTATASSVCSSALLISVLYGEHAYDLA